MITDEMLTAQFLRGDISAFEELVNRYKHSVFNIIYRMTRDYQEAEDIAQEVFATVYQKLNQFDNSKKFAPWIHRIAVNTCISSLRKRNKVILLNYDDTYTNQQPETDNSQYYESPATTMEREELKLKIKAAIQELPDNYQSVLILRYQSDLSNQEIAETLGISKENVEVKIHRARKALRKIIMKRWEEDGRKDELPGH